MKLTLLKAHLGSNRYDGYPAHHHWMLIAVEPETYQKKILGITIYPGAEWARLILDPRALPWIRDNVTQVGYGFRDLVDPEHRGFYAFGEKGELHDGIDGQVLPGGPGRYLRDVYGTYNNNNGYKPSAELYEIDYNDLKPETRFQTLDQVAVWYKPALQKLIDSGAIQGTGQGFNLSEDMLRTFTIVLNHIEKTNKKEVSV